MTGDGPRTAGRVLVVDDDHSLRHALTRALELEHYDVVEAKDGIEALEVFEAGAALDVVILDLLMPRLDGLATCREIRAKSRVPILILTARGDVDDRVEGLDAGADDYLSKPFAVVELLARVRALLRRTSTTDETLHYADLELDSVEHRVSRGGREIDLTRIEFSLLEFFLSNPRRVLGRREIFQQVWGYDPELASNSLEVYVGYLRRKTEASGEPRLIHTVRGIGYVLRETL